MKLLAEKEKIIDDLPIYLTLFQLHKSFLLLISDQKEMGIGNVTLGSPPTIEGIKSTSASYLPAAILAYNWTVIVPSLAKPGRPKTLDSGFLRLFPLASRTLIAGPVPITQPRNTPGPMSVSRGWINADEKCHGVRAVDASAYPTPQRLWQWNSGT